MLLIGQKHPGAEDSYSWDRGPPYCSQGVLIFNSGIPATASWAVSKAKLPLPCLNRHQHLTGNHTLLHYPGAAGRGQPLQLGPRTLCLACPAGDANQLLVGADCSKVLRGARYGVPPAPKVGKGSSPQKRSDRDMYH